MERISEENFNLLLRLATNQSMDADMELFDSLDTSDITFNEKAEKRILRAIRHDNTEAVRKKWLNAIQRVAAVVLIVTTTFFAMAMCIEPVRAAFINAIVTWYEDYVSIWFGEKDADAPKTIEKEYTIANLPDGWTMEKISEDSLSVVHMLYGPDGEMVVFQQSVQTGSDVLYDNDCYENSIPLKQDIIATVLEYEDGRVCLTWRADYEFCLDGENVSRDVLISIANSMCELINY